MTIISYVAQLLEFFQTKFFESGSVYLARHESSGILENKCASRVDAFILDTGNRHDFRRNVANNSHV